MDENSSKENQRKGEKRSKRKKKENLSIHEIIKLKPENIPSNWKFMGYKKCIIQDFIIKPHNIEYQLEIWKNPFTNCSYIGKLPESLQNTHFGNTLKAYIIHQYYHCGVTQPLLYSSLSDLFTYFSTTLSKSRINFLTILTQENQQYTLTQNSLDYLIKYQNASYYQKLVQEFHKNGKVVLMNKEAFDQYCKTHEITAKYILAKVEEAFLIGTLMENGFRKETLIHSDGALQFDLFEHSLCWKHAERPLIKVKCYNSYQEIQYSKKKKAFWELYQALKEYKQNPTPLIKEKLENDFDKLCKHIDYYFSLNEVLNTLKAQKDDLLKVLTYPQTSLHNNDSERDIREMVKRRIISGSTRSENGKKAKDTFLSLKKTCMKLGISFWKYLLDRINQEFEIDPLKDIMRQKKQA